MKEFKTEISTYLTTRPNVNHLLQFNILEKMIHKLQFWIIFFALLLTLIGVIGGLFFSPADWQQGDSFRIMYIHVPAALLANGGYFALALCGICTLIWKHPLSDLFAFEIAPVGATATTLCLITGSIWGKPTWGTWWVWDARLTSVLILFFLYLGHIILIRAFDDPQKGYKAAAVLALIGAFDLPIIKFSVRWWNTLHQPDTFSLTHAPSIPLSMMWPLLFSISGFTLGFITLVLLRLRAALIEHQIYALSK